MAIIYRKYSLLGKMGFHMAASALEKKVKNEKD